MAEFLGWNIFLSYGEAADKAAKKNGYVFLGYAKDAMQTEVKVYRMWKMSDKRKELEAQKKRKKK